MIILPSLLNANTYNIKEQLQILKDKGIDHLHVDVMDGQFVPSQAFGPNTVNDLKNMTDFKLDVHLMIENPEKHIPLYKNADIITVHYESTRHLYRAIQLIKNMGLKACVAINPATSVSMIEEVLPMLDQVLVMTINPGVPGEKFIAQTMTKIEKLNQLKKEKNYNFNIEVDGNVNKDTINECLKAGANMFVSGSYVFNGSIPSNIDYLLEEVKKYEY
ncbi:ribulose-phosphate 3-epimerase [Catenibacterium sp.]|uniref:ribulose-phosphate 3-epimerase n=1 Tax=Catenibacterium sp. TaxID=2049022 RepID=UPI002E75DA1A|nr:ribulose-phosphate 3-epimerase [Catenibacterium sp.]MEE0042700.1 ribulose-phosphate 3-epimerase [Catenibacterium sp.]